MAETLTYEAADPQAPEFTPDEVDSLKVGEELVAKQEQLLAGKYQNAEELEKAYVALEKKLGSPKEVESEPNVELIESKEQEEPKEQEEKIDTSFLEKLWVESQGNNFKEETLNELSSMDPQSLAKMYLEERSTRSKVKSPEPMTKEAEQRLKGIAGGEKEYNAMIGWAKENLSKGDIEMYDEIMQRNDPLSAYFAIQALFSRYTDSIGTEPTLLTGKPASSTPKDEYRSQAELVRAMNDPRYDQDPAYRQDVMKKLERSNVNF
mgnify:CR=1 FL=1